MAPVSLPIQGMTTYEQMLHDDYQKMFGQGIDHGLVNAGE
jgi:hypothetical protein